MIVLDTRISKDDYLEKKMEYQSSGNGELSFEGYKVIKKYEVFEVAMKCALEINESIIAIECKGNNESIVENIGKNLAYIINYLDGKGCFTLSKENRNLTAKVYSNNGVDVVGTFIFRTCSNKRASELEGKLLAKDSALVGTKTLYYVFN